MPCLLTEWSVSRLNIGTNYFINSLAQRSHLVPVSVVRLCGPATRALGPFDDFPEDLRKLISSKCFYVNGGYQVDGSVITDLDEKEIMDVIKEIKESNIRNVVISGVFSFMKTDQEKQNPGNITESTVPFVDESTGEWILSEYDVHCISIGTGILGSGGGGAPKIGLLRALTTLKKGRKIRVIHPERLKTKSFKNGKVGVPAFVGAPTVGNEKFASGREMVEALECIEKILKTDLLDENNKKQLDVKEDGNITYITHFDLTPLEGTQTNTRDIVALMCLEIGGSNATETLCAGADMGLPVLDCDGMGRAFPELQSSFQLGDAVLKAQKESSDPVESICEQGGGVHLITGKITNVSQETNGGFDRGITEIEGTGKYGDQEMIVEFQNENLIAKRRHTAEEKVVVTTPDIITVVGVDTGMAITNDIIKSGMHVAVIALLSAPQLRTKVALEVVGPKAFGYDTDYTPIGEYHSNCTIPLPP
ncbi:hypothetical protein HOLleu_07369 [Holothuria leucospilota]|uniref:Uncharacterized protein n=1 Tax=Holothuria leucospilota TaxID=206669 RepID=A0A9Q1CGL4_HOLLE|nr:hypothetical protein HOLleu_07369 [Holothuria leucospilota]